MMSASLHQAPATDKKLQKHKESAWLRRFSCSEARPLIICRGPVRLEAMQVFEEMGIQSYGLLISEKDSIAYARALAPELRYLYSRPQGSSGVGIHYVKDYSGVDRNEREKRIREIVNIAVDHGYDSIFAGYGFMAEDEALSSAMEQAGLIFIGPCSQTMRRASLKDEAKRAALMAEVSVVPGVDDLSAQTLLSKYLDLKALRVLARRHKLKIAEALWKEGNLEQLANAMLSASYARGVELFTLGELCEQARLQAIKLFSAHPEQRIRIKAVGGGGGKGQRILQSPAQFKGALKQRIAAAAQQMISLVPEALSEVKAVGPTDNKNLLIELNIEETRHQEIQVIGNGSWCLSLGGRDCSLQMHEQKLVEVSVTQEALRKEIAQTKEGKAQLEADLKMLEEMEAEAERFGTEVQLDSVSTFECIVEKKNHFFMEMNTRIQVEHRVTELCYLLRFVNPDDAADYFDVDSIIKAMVMLAYHKSALPRPQRIVRHGAAVEVRHNATSDALAPHAGGVIEDWQLPSELICDDQGICNHNPDSGAFIPYHLTGAYDSNISLLLACGDTRAAAFETLAEGLRAMVLRGKNLKTNLSFLYGLVNWILGQNVNAQFTTGFIQPYLNSVGLLKKEASLLDLRVLWQAMLERVPAEKRPVLAAKETLILRPLALLLESPHRLAGWLGRHPLPIEVSAMNGGKNDAGEKTKRPRQAKTTTHKLRIEWTENPLLVLQALYRYLRLESRQDSSALEMIWDHDEQLLETGLSFYRDLAERLSVDSYPELISRLSGAKAQRFSAKLWDEARVTHEAWQMGMDILLTIHYVAEQSGFHQLKVKPDLSPTIPKWLVNSDLQAEVAKLLDPPPRATGNQIVAPSGGAYYASEAPDLPPLVEEGARFETGDALCVIEVMKMFNKLSAPFSGRIERVLITDDQTVIQQGQPLFEVVPDALIVEDDHDAQAARDASMNNFLASYLANSAKTA